MRLVAIAAAVLITAISMPAAAWARSDEQVWTTAAATVKLSDKWRLQQELTARFSHDRDGLYEIESVSLLGYRLSKDVTVAAGYAIVYLTAAWWIAGRTVGCEVMGLRVVGLRGGNPAFLVALLRAVMYTFFAVGLVWCAVSPRRRSVQDILVGTSVIYDWRHHG